MGMFFWCNRIVCSALHVCKDTAAYIILFLSFYLFNCGIDHPIVTTLLHGNKISAVHLFTLSKQLLLWDAPHYRATSFAADLRNNLQNVAIPGTGVPLSLFCYSRWTALLFILLVNPFVSLAAACYLVYWLGPSRLRPYNQGSNSGLHRQAAQVHSSVAEAYHELLLCPQHWFAIWRHNCLLAGYHALMTGSSSYRLEDKGAFLLEGDHLGLPVSPYYRDAAVFVKHKSVEGGMGIHVYKNFAHGGDWIIQKALRNSSALEQLLPDAAPLSTFRVVTVSTAWLTQKCKKSHHPAQQCPSTLMQHWGTSRYEESSTCTVLQEVGLAQDGVDTNTGAQLVTPDQDGDKDRVQSHPPRAPTPPLPLSRAVVSPQKMTGQLTRHPPNAARVPATSASSSPHAAETQQAEPQLEEQPGQMPLQQRPVGGQETPYPLHASAAENTGCNHQDDHVKVVSAVWRAGLAGADTDHASVCFDLDTDSGMLGPGVGANHWYRLGWSGIAALRRSDHQEQYMHPQSGKRVAGVVISKTPHIVATVVQAHIRAAPDVPLIGWDIAVTPSGVFILEINLSCNLFNGQFDREGYYEVLYWYLAELGLAKARSPDRAVAAH